MPNFVDRKNCLIAQFQYEEKYCLFNTTDTLLIQWQKKLLTLLYEIDIIAPTSAAKQNDT